MVFAIILIVARWRKWPKGTLFLTYIVLYSVGRFSLEFLRGDSPRVLGLTTAQWSSVAMIAVAVIVGVVLSIKSSKHVGTD